MKRYDLFVRLNGPEPPRPVDWRELANLFHLHLVRERVTQVTVEAEPAAIEELRQAYPDIGVTVPKTYHKLDPSGVGPEFEPTESR